MPPLLSRSLLALALILALSLPAPICLAEQEKSSGPRIRVTLPEAWTPERLAELQATREATWKRISFETDGIGLGEALEKIGAEAGVNITVNWPALEIVGIDPDTLVTLRLKDVTIGLVLNEVAGQASAEQFDYDKLDWVVRPGVIKLDTVDNLIMDTEVRFYDVGPILREPFRPLDMLFEEEAFDHAIAFRSWARDQRSYPFTDELLVDMYRKHIQQMNRELDRLNERIARMDGPEGDPPPDRGRGGGGGGGLFGDDDPKKGPRLADAIDDLVELIQETTGDPNRWLDEDSTIEVHESLFVIKTDLETHREVERLLNQLLQAELDEQASVMADAMVSRLLYRASMKAEEGDPAGGLALVEQALRIDPDHLPANAMRRVFADMVKAQPQDQE